LTPTSRVSIYLTVFVIGNMIPPAFRHADSFGV
jgi:hypothetical protein